MRPINEVIAHIRAVVANPNVNTTLIQTEDLAALCDAIDPPISSGVEDALTPHPDWKVQHCKYYAAHFLVGLPIDASLDSKVSALADVLQKQYDIGVEHGQNAVPRAVG